MFGIALVLRAGGSVAAFLTGTPQPDAGAAAGLAVLFNPGDPATALGADGLNPVAYWLVSAALLGGLATGIVWVWIVLRRHTRKTETDPHRLAGIATSHEVKTAASAKALLHRAATLRPPSLESPAPQDVGYLLGASRGTEGLGICRRLDPADRPTPLRQGPTCRHQRDPRRTRSGRHHQHQARQPHRDPPRPTPQGGRTGRGVRPATPRRRHPPRRAALVAHSRL